MRVRELRAFLRADGRERRYRRSVGYHPVGLHTSAPAEERRFSAQFGRVSGKQFMVGQPGLIGGRWPRDLRIPDPPVRVALGGKSRPLASHHETVLRMDDIVSVARTLR